MNAPPPRWRWPLAVVTWLVGVTGAVAWGIGALDQYAGATGAGAALVGWGRPLGLVFVPLALLIKPRGHGTVRKLMAIAVGVWPFLAFGLFLRWQITMSAEQMALCEAENWRECERLAIRREKRGRFDDAQPLFARACEGGIARACTNAGAMMRDGRGTAPSATGAAELLVAGCDGGDPLACQLLGQIYKRGGDLPADPERSLAFFARACEGGLASACAEVEATAAARD